MGWNDQTPKSSVRILNYWIDEVRTVWEGILGVSSRIVICINSRVTHDTLNALIKRVQRTFTSNPRPLSSLNYWAMNKSSGSPCTPSVVGALPTWSTKLSEKGSSPAVANSTDSLLIF